MPKHLLKQETLGRRTRACCPDGGLATTHLYEAYTVRGSRVMQLSPFWFLNVRGSILDTLPHDPQKEKKLRTQLRITVIRLGHFSHCRKHFWLTTNHRHSPLSSWPSARELHHLPACLSPTLRMKTVIPGMWRHCLMWTGFSISFLLCSIPSI